MTRQEADILLSALVETIVRDPDCIDRRRPLFSLMRLFIWLAKRSEDTNGRSAPDSVGSDCEGSVSGQVSLLPWKERHALLLFVVEELPEEQAAELLGVGVSTFRQLVADARWRIATRQ